MKKKNLTCQIARWIFIITSLLVLIWLTILFLNSEMKFIYLLQQLSILLVIAAGFFLPIYIGSGERKLRGEQWLLKEKTKWCFHGRDRNGLWLNYIEEPLVRKADCATGVNFYSEWLVIKGGCIIVNPGESTLNGNTITYNCKSHRTYAWDGCTPKFFFYWFMILGTPDWWSKKVTVQYIDNQNNISSKTVFWQLAHHASLVHDALYQYLNVVPIKKKDIDELFRNMLKDAGMNAFVALIYKTAVCMFGAARVSYTPVDQSMMHVAGLPPCIADKKGDNALV